VILAILAVWFDSSKSEHANQYLGVNCNCHEWQLVTTAVNTRKPKLHQFMTLPI